MGKTILFLHGFGGSKNSFFSVFDHFSAFFHCICIDFAGFGDNPEPLVPYTVRDYALDIKLFLKAKKIDNVVIVAHSFGCRIALKLYSIFPEIIDKLIITGGAGLKPKRTILYYCKIANYKIAKALVACHILDKKILSKYGSSDYKSLSNVMKKTFVNVVGEDLSACAKLVKCKTLLFWGEKDIETPLYMAKRLKKYMKCSRLIIREGKGHFAYLEDDIVFKECITDFLNERE